MHKFFQFVFFFLYSTFDIFLKGQKMNCIIHNDSPAVGTCGKCGCGICSACVQNSIKAEGIDKPVCKNCAIEGISLYIEYLKTLLKATRTKKIVWTAILFVGACFVVGGYIGIPTNPNAPFYFMAGIIIWALAGFTDRILVEKSGGEQLQDAMVWRDAMVGHNYVWGFWLGKFIFWAVKSLMRGIFFPFVYAHFMIMGQKDIQKQIAEQQAILDNL